MNLWGAFWNSWKYMWEIIRVGTITRYISQKDIMMEVLDNLPTWGRLTETSICALLGTFRGRLGVMSAGPCTCVPTETFWGDFNEEPLIVSIRTTKRYCVELPNRMPWGCLTETSLSLLFEIFRYIQVHETFMMAGQWTFVSKYQRMSRWCAKSGFVRTLNWDVIGCVIWLAVTPSLWNYVFMQGEWWLKQWA